MDSFPHGKAAILRSDGICNPVRNVLCGIGCLDFAQNGSGGVSNPAALRQPGGLPAISRRLSAAIPPVNVKKDPRPRRGRSNPSMN